MRSKFYTILFSVLLLLAISASVVWAGTTGKIAGVVQDAETNEPLPGVNVIVEGTSYGAATNLKGEYTIINLPPGRYNITASMMGYTSVRYENVRVSIDLTTKINFELSPTVLEAGEEVTIVAERPIVQRDMTSSMATVGADEIASMPVESVNDVLSLQAGIVNAGGMHIRGGRSGEVAYWVDGLATTDVYNSSNTAAIENSAVQELQVISGTFNAEYGQAMSGIINIVTKDGGSEYHGQVSGYVGDYMSGDDMYMVMEDVIDHIDPVTEEVTQEIKKSYPLKDFNPSYSLEGSFSGPIPFTNDKLTFFMNGRYRSEDGYLYGREWYLPQGIPGDSSLVPMNKWRNYTGLGKLTWRATDAMKLTYSINASDYYRPNGGYNHTHKYVPGFGLQNFSNQLTQTLSLNHVLSSKTFYEIKVRRMENESQSYMYEDPNARPNWLVTYQMPTDTTGESFEPITFNPNENPAMLDSVDQWGYDYDWVVDPDDPEGYIHPDSTREPTGYSYLDSGTNNWRGYRKTAYWIGKFDITSQLNTANQIKAGVEMRFHELSLDNYNLVAAIDPVDSTQIVPFQPSIPAASTVNRDKYYRTPREISAYIQDKIELNELIMNIGVRFDYFDSDYVVPADPTDPNIYDPFKNEHIYKEYDAAYAAGLEPLEYEQYLGSLDEYTPDERRDFMHKAVDPKMQISPRLGIAYPITDRGVIHFSYGHFFQMPEFQYLYSAPDFILNSGGGRSIMGNADLGAQKTVQYEIGLQQQLGTDIGIDVTVFYRDIRDWVGTSPLVDTFRPGVLYSTYENKDYSNVRGITFKMDKRFSNNFAFQVDYSLMWAEGTYSNPNDAFNAVNSNEQPRLNLIPMNWDQRHTLNAQFMYQFKGWTASLIGIYKTGLPYTPSFARGAFVGGNAFGGLPTNSSIRPDQYYADLRIDKEWRLDNGLRLAVFAFVENLFDTRGVTSVFSDTGSPDYTTNPKLENVDYDQRRVSTVDDYFSRPHWYISPRQARVGVRIGF